MAFKTHRTLKLNTGSSIPVVGLGTWQSGPGEVRNAVYHALKCGYKHIDAAFVYGNEEEVGDGIRRALEDHVITREELFVTSKLWCTYHRNPQKCLDEGLEKLGLDYVDLYLMHWPVPMNPNGNHPLFPKHTDGTRDLDTTWSHVQTYKEMEKLLATGKAKAIGVSNYSVKYLEELLPKVDVVPAVNQIENHPLLPQQDIVDYCHWKGIVVEAFSPLGSTDSPLFSEDIVLEIAAKYGIGAGSVLISYQGLCYNPREKAASLSDSSLTVIQRQRVTWCCQSLRRLRGFRIICILSTLTHLTWRHWKRLTSTDARSALCTRLSG